ncbi:hypothetical protein BS47DRAFT_99750 [Hydnum rufescens UP504]|uniref:DUF6534 domain-containing protein n=1 Tax=Hydnum rufescens UP504 TaxID=1448309 RepID=A0A9P6DT19_9AGAM|nr:hypothetical protein BS47DRAFT_99750 [Hydnum rufescens UP504]
MSDGLQNVFGGGLTGVVLTSAIFGVITTQSFAYYRSFPQDPLYIKSVIAFLWLLQGFQLGCLVKALYTYLLWNYGHSEFLALAIWEGSVYQTTTVVAATTVQLFFAYRVHTLSPTRWIGFVIQALILIHFGFGVASSARAYILGTLFGIAVEEKWLIATWLGSEVVTDLALAASMTILLRKQRTGFKRTDNALNKLVIYTINTGTITSVVAVIVLVTFVVAGFHFIVLSFGIPLGGIYTVTMLANLHSRLTIRGYLAPRSSTSAHQLQIAKIRMQFEVCTMANPA